MVFFMSFKQYNFDCNYFTFLILNTYHNNYQYRNNYRVNISNILDTGNYVLTNITLKYKQIECLNVLKPFKIVLSLSLKNAIKQYCM